MLFVAAEAREFGGLLPYCDSVEKLDWQIEWGRMANLNGRRIFLVANGAGRRLAAEAVDQARKRAPDLNAVISTGFCGGLDPSLRIGDVFVATRIQSGEDLVSVRAPHSTRAFASGTLVTLDRVAQTAREKRDLCSAGASAVDMEAAGVFSRVREWEVPFYCIRSVTDLADESFQIDFNATRTAKGRFSTSRILAAAMKRPMTAAPELARLRSRCHTAAKALGEFIADCRF